MEKNKNNSESSPTPQAKRSQESRFRYVTKAVRLVAIRLKYLEKAGLGLWSPASYTYIKVGEQKQIMPSKKRGKRLNILRIYSQNQNLNYALSIGSFTPENFINILDKEAREAAQNRVKTGADTIIVLENYSIHKSHQVRAKEREWHSIGLYLFFLPTYSPELNLIEGEWHQIKTHEISGRMFEDEYDLVQAVKESLTHRSAQVGDQIHHFKLNSKCINVQSQNE